MEIALANAALSDHSLDGCADLGAHLVAMRLGPIDPQIALNRLDHIVDEVPKKWLAVDGFVVRGDRQCGDENRPRFVLDRVFIVGTKVGSRDESN